MPSRPIITLTTDFGHADAYVGAMKGVILSIAPEATIVDLCHEVPPHNLPAGAFVFESAFALYPPRTVHTVVVDPGVGSDRPAIAVETERYVFVAPDNGVLTEALSDARVDRIIRLTNPLFHRHPVSATFHGRDIFAPAAAHLAAGAPIEELGEIVETLVRLDLPHPVPVGGDLELHVAYIDRFGNIVTDMKVEDYVRWRGERGGAPVVLRVGTWRISGISRTYSDVE